MLENIKQNYKNEIEEILYALKDCVFDELDDDNFYTSVVEIFKQKYKKSFQYDEGCTKGVLIFKEYHFVIKIPFIYHDGEILSRAYDGFDDWDYCSQEENYYEKARTNGFEQVFLETSFLTKINNHPIYIQPCADSVGSDIDHNNSEEDEKTTEEIRESYGYDCVDSLWETDLFVSYGKDYYIKLKKYIENNVDDLHNSNIGYLNGYPIIFDYAGYGD